MINVIVSTVRNIAQSSSLLFSSKNNNFDVFRNGAIREMPNPIIVSDGYNKGSCGCRIPCFAFIGASFFRKTTHKLKLEVGLCT